MSWRKKERCWMKGLSWKQEQKLCTRREELCAALKCASSFQCKVEEWKDCEAEAKANRKVDVCGPEEGGNEAYT